MHRKLDKINSILTTVLYFFALLFVVYGFIKVYRDENALVYFLLGGCFGILSTGKKLWDKKGGQ